MSIATRSVATRSIATRWVATGQIPSARRFRVSRSRENGVARSAPLPRQGSVTSEVGKFRQTTDPRPLVTAGGETGGPPGLGPSGPRWVRRPIPEGTPRLGSIPSDVHPRFSGKIQARGGIPGDARIGASGLSGDLSPGSPAGCCRGTLESRALWNANATPVQPVEDCERDD